MTDPDPSSAPQAYDKRKLSYAKTFSNPLHVTIIRMLEWATGKLTLLRLIRRLEAEGLIHGHGFWRQALGIMGIDVTTPPDQIARIPATGPLVVVANHPHGLVDGMVLAELIGRVRKDYKILARALLTDVQEVKSFLVPVPFPHDADAQQRLLAMRRSAMAHLAEGGAVVVFPAGAIARAEHLFGPAREGAWSVFTAQLILRSKASVVPIRFLGQNSRWYQIAAQIAAPLRQGLLLHEVVQALNRPQGPIIGEVISSEDLVQWRSDPRGLAAWLRERTLALTG